MEEAGFSLRVGVPRLVDQPDRVVVPAFQQPLRGLHQQQVRRPGRLVETPHERLERLELGDQVETVSQHGVGIHPPSAPPRGVLVGARPSAEVERLVGDGEAFGQVVDREAGGVPGLETQEGCLGIIALGWQVERLDRAEGIAGGHELGADAGRAHRVALAELRQRVHAELVHAPGDAAAVPDTDDGGRVGQRGEVSAVARLVGRLLAREERVANGAAAVELARPLDELPRPGHGPSVGVSGGS